MSSKAYQPFLNQHRLNSSSPSNLLQALPACCSAAVPPLTTPSLSLWLCPAVHTLSVCCWRVPAWSHISLVEHWATHPWTPWTWNTHPSQSSLHQSLYPLKLLIFLSSLDATTHSWFLCLSLGCFTVRTFCLSCSFLSMLQNTCQNEVL